MTTLHDAVKLARNKSMAEAQKNRENAVLTNIYLQGQYTVRQLAAMSDLPLTTLWRRMNKHYDTYYNKS